MCIRDSPIQDAIEGITHSMCSLEFENHRPLYNWVIENIFGTAFPKQREFARLNMTNTVMSKRYLRELVAVSYTQLDVYKRQLFCSG